MSWSRRIRRKMIWGAALGLAAAAVSPTIASASSVDAKSVIEQHLANEARAVASEDGYAGVARPDGYQPQLRGDEALVIRDKPDGYQPQTRGAEVAVAATGDSIDWANVAFGLGLGLGIAALCALMLLERSRVRMLQA